MSPLTTLSLLQGTADLLVPASIAKDLAAVRSPPTTYLETGAAHLQSFKEDPARYRAAFLAFLKGVTG